MKIKLEKQRKLLLSVLGEGELFIFFRKIKFC